MKKNRQILLTCIISIIILICVYFALTAHGSGEEKIVYMLKTDISAGTVIESGMLFSAMISKDVPLPNSISSIEDMDNKIVVRNMKSGDILSVDDLGNPVEGVIYPELEEGMELYSISVKPENANGWWLYEENRINLYIYLPEVIGYNAQESLDSKILKKPGDSVTVYENIRIMKILNENGEPAALGDKNSRIICMELDSEQVKVLVAAEKGGIVRLSARNK
ncbi:MAG: SAF domain-containing protein [Saccharofermentanales bacterium]